MEMKPLLLVGGRSSRMGTRKELLPFPDGRLALDHALETLSTAVSDATSIYISLHDKSQLDAILLAMQEQGQDHARFPAIVPLVDHQAEEIGPAAGLLAAHAMFPDATFLVLACDYPLLPPAALKKLMAEYVSPVTCFLNEDGFLEPLIAIWGPEGLERLKKNVEGGSNSLNSVVKQIGGKTVTPLRQEWIRGANTKEEWDKVMELLINENPH